MSTSTIRTIAFGAIGAALIAAFSQISISLGPIPFTLQTLAIGLLATSLKTKEATFSVAIYLLLGAIGLPVFAGQSGGFQALIGPAAGFLWGFLFYASLTSSLVSLQSPIWKVFIANLLGDALVFLLGAIIYALHLQISLNDSAVAVVLPFLIGDFLKISFITFTAPLLGKSLASLPYFKPTLKK